MTDAIGLGPFQFALTEQGQLAGSLGLRLGKHETGHIGYWGAPNTRGRGTTTRALGGSVATRSTSYISSGLT